ncbi:MAG: trypsin-like peptidase domain-containing protein [Myxococcales bacterium]|nr:trypsin-like peptidase domain-containing protein [Myxococcales bacterium]
MGKRILALVIGLASLAATARADDPFLRRTATVEVVEKVGPAVVNITTERIVVTSPFGFRSPNPMFDQFFRDFFEPRLQHTLQSLGSGVLIDPEGRVLTNEHVVDRASRIRVSVGDGRELDATLIGADPNNDIAVLQLKDGEGLPWIPLGSSDDLLVGEPVIAIGNPFGLSSTVTTGVISALDRSVRTDQRVFRGFLQTDASINPGNSGGPLLNAEGELIAINTAVYQGGQGIGFAIPIDTAKRVIHELIAHGEVAPVWLGLDFQDLDAALVEALQLPANLRGALVNRVRERSPAHRAGIRRRDVVTHVDGSPVSSARGFFERLETVTDGQELRIDLWRDGEARSLTARAEEIPHDRVVPLLEDLLGMRLGPRANGGSYSVREVRAGSGAARIGIQPGDLVLGINGRPLDDVDSLRRSALELRGRHRALVVVQRGSGRYHVTIPMV